MNHPLVSIIIPIYKVEQYLRRCLDSIVNQTYTNLEIILVDDGSPDGCPQICDEFAAKDNRIVVIHKENGGLSDARNAGLNICKGVYISFVDSDDWINPQYIDVLIDIATKEKADIAISEYIKTTENNRKKQNIIFKKNFSSKDALLRLFSKNNIAFTVSWGKLYKRELFSSLRFPIGKYHEDEFTTYILFYNSKKIVYTSEILYYYYQRAGSIVSTRHPWDILEYLEQRYIFFKEKKESDLLPLLLPPLCWQLLCAYWHQSKNKNISNNYLNKLRFYIKDFQHIKKPLLHYIPLKIFAYIPQLYLIYRRISPLHIRKEF
ncbi:glycosyltransferase [uncultured Fibrobacter sp.]|uniref:glycosyltransferase family 2 protein n=1 Tax=uncultured Fibrobacter sp. TaxID=261512 RepID=UPI0025FC3FBD|nr:glycosyltransferase [uncultured Fibrobacter sp.]